MHYLNRAMIVTISVVALSAGLAGAAGAKTLHGQHHHHGMQVAHKHRAPRLPPIVVADISVSRQNLYLTVDGWPSESWAVSTAGVGYHTPRGTFHVQRMAKIWFSKKYDNSPMPNSVFFDGGIAIHGTYHINALGRAVSHGCVRLAPENAAKLFALVEKYGTSRTRITVTD